MSFPSNRHGMTLHIFMTGRGRQRKEYKKQLERAPRQMNRVKKEYKGSTGEPESKKARKPTETLGVSRDGVINLTINIGS